MYRAQKRLDNRALVLEGGGMRGIFTAGILDHFMEQGVEFPYTIGVSAGVTNAISYISKQIGRTLYADTTLMQEHNYIGLKTLLKRGTLIDMKLLFEEFPDSIYPIDWECFTQNPNAFEMVTTDIIDAKACYFSKPQTIERLKLIAMASCALPIINQPVEIDGTPMLDGGLSDSIPLARAFEMGYKEAVVVLTQCRGYRKSKGSLKLPKWLTAKYPNVVELLNSRAERYNAQLEWIEELEREGEIEVLRPTSLMEVGRLSTNYNNLRALYKHGYTTAQEWLDQQPR